MMGARTVILRLIAAVCLGAISIGTLIGVAFCSQGDFELSYPSRVVSSRPILEFRARKGNMLQNSPGHAFIFLGRQLDNGDIILYGAAGFYPKNHSIIQSILGTPGKIDYTIADMAPDVTFRVKITEDQERLVKYIIKNWDSKEYATTSQNCTSLVKDVAAAVGLQFNDKAIIPEYPYTVVNQIASMNKDYTPLDHAMSEANRLRSLRGAATADMKGIIQCQADFWKRIHDAQNEKAFSASVGQVGSATSGSGTGFGVPFGAAPVSGSNESSTMTFVYPTWPWPQP